MKWGAGPEGRSRPYRKLLTANGVPGGCRDLWDDPDDQAELRVQVEAIERRQLHQAAVLGVV